MAENIGTHVADKIVTPDDGDAFPTHDQDFGKGGYRSVQTVVEMNAITTLRRTDGMQVRVVNDGVPADNGVYVLQPDLTTFVKEAMDTALGSPEDGDWGNESNGDDHNLTGVSTGDSQEVAMDKVLTYLNQTAPTPPPTIDTLNLLITNLYSANKQGEVSHIQADNIQVNVQPTGTLSAKFGDSKSGIAKAQVDGIDAGSKTLTSGIDDGTFGTLTLSNEEAFATIYQQIDGSIQSGIALALNNIQHNYRILHGILETNTDFYVDDPVQPNVITMALVGDHVAPILFISGVPSLDVGDSLKTTMTITSAVSWFYNLLTFGRVESAYTNDADTGLVTGKNNGDNVVFTDFITAVIDTVYTEDADVTGLGFNSRFGTPAEIGTDKGSNTTTGTSGTIRIDTVSDESIRLTSGAGQFPSVGGGAAGQAFNSTTTLDTGGNEELQLINGKFKYPSGNYTGNNPTVGPNYTVVPAGTFNGQRWTTFSLGVITAQTSVEFEISGQVGFNGAPIESGDYSLYVIVDGATGWLDANAAYPGGGDPVANGDPALDVASSDIDTKRVTFGTIPRTGTVLVRIGWKTTEAREITLIQ